MLGQRRWPPPYEPVISLATLAIAARSLETLSRSQGLGDLARIYVKAKADSIDFNLAFIPVRFNAPRPAPFDNGYMKALFNLGLKLGRAGYPWIKVPPELSVEASR